MFFTQSPYAYSFALLFSISLFLVFAPRILPPKPIEITPKDELDDQLLFQKASAASSRNLLHLDIKNPKPKIAFCFLTNQQLVFAPLWQKFFHQKTPFYNIYVHATPGVANPGGVFDATFIPARPTQRASPTLISATRRLLATAVIHDPLNLYFAVVSESCIPLRSFGFIYRGLLGDSDIRAFKTQGVHRSYVEVIAKDKHLLERYNARGRGVMLPEVRFDQFRVGSQFFILAKRHAMIVIRDMRLWRKFKRRCVNGNSCYPEEHYFSTLLSMEDNEGCSGFSLTRVDWTGSVSGHPYTYDRQEVSPELVYKLRESNSSQGYFFARKFSPDCLDPLMEMADNVLFKD